VKRGDRFLQADVPGLNAPGVRFVIASFPLIDGAGPSRDVKTMIARSIVGAIQTYSRGGHQTMGCSVLAGTTGSCEMVRSKMKGQL
jgi:hypothetical protein